MEKTEKFEIEFYVRSDDPGDFNSENRRSFEGTYEDAIKDAKSEFTDWENLDWEVIGGDPEAFEVVSAYFDSTTGDEISKEKAEELMEQGDDLVSTQIEGFQIWTEDEEPEGRFESKKTKKPVVQESMKVNEKLLDSSVRSILSTGDVRKSILG